MAVEGSGDWGLVSILRTKLLPPTSAQKLIDRPRLGRQIERLGRTRLTFVRAPAGFGKTSLLAQWFQTLRESGALAAWLSFDDGDRDAAGMLSYLAAALEAAGHQFGAEVTSLFGKDRYATPDAMSTAIINDLCAAAQPRFLFLDDLHVLRAPHVIAALTTFLAHAPDELHVAIATRETPELPLARARAFGNVVEITTTDLRFSTDETAAFMARAGKRVLEPADIAALDGRLEGWVAGLKLAAIALDGEVDAGRLLKSISGRNWTFTEFFAQVVIAQLPTELVQFLIATSVLDRLSPGLCDAVTGGSAARGLLDEIEARGLFLFSLDGERHWYRYHHLFAEYLRAELRRRFPAREPELHARASRWLAAAGLQADAFAHAVKAGDEMLAAHILDRCCQTMFYDGQNRVLLENAAQISPAVLAQFPRVLLTQAWSLILEWKFDRARAILAQVEARLRDAAGDLSNAPEYGLYLHCSMMLAQFEDDMPTVERQCLLLLDAFTDADPYIVGTYYTSLLYAEREQFKLSNIARLDVRARDYFQLAGSRFVIVWHQSIAGPSLFLAGETAAAIEALTEGLEAATAISGPHSALASIPGLLLAEVHYERNELKAASALLDRHLPRAAELGFVDQLVAGYVTCARLHQLHGNEVEAGRVLAQAMTLARGRGFARLAQNIVAEQLAQAARAGRHEDVCRLARTHDLQGPPERMLPGNVTTTASEARALGWVAAAQISDRKTDALRVAEHWLEFSARAGAVRSEIRWAVIVTELRLSSGEERRAETLLRQALGRATPGRFMRSFLDAGELVTALIRRCQAGRADADRASGSFAAQLLAAAEKLPRVVPAGDAARLPLGEPLSTREVSIIEHVAAGMSNREIAERLCITEGTVKWYLHGIFDKIGARRRTQVVEVARRIGIIG